MPQFTPSPRVAVEAMAEMHRHVFDTAHIGEGLRVVYKIDEQHERNFTRLVEEHGWYVASYEALDHGDAVTLMPIREGPADE